MTLPGVNFKPIDPTSPTVAELVALLDALQVSLYPPASVHSLPLDSLKQANAVFLGAFHGEQLVGCGGFVIHNDEYGELKRMIVHPDVRGQGIGRRLLESLEVEAIKAKVSVLRLETGVSQPEALRLYERSGYARRGPFGSYTDDPLSVFMEKQLA